MNETTLKKKIYRIEDYIKKIKSDEYIIYSNGFCETFDSCIEFVDNYMDFANTIIED